jgi:hypothetical protein
MAAFDSVYCYAKLRLYSVIFPFGLKRPGLRLANNDFAGIASICAQFSAGIRLLLGGRGLANLLHRMRTPPALPDMPTSTPHDGHAGQAPWVKAPKSRDSRDVAVRALCPRRRL